MRWVDEARGGLPLPSPLARRSNSSEGGFPWGKSAKILDNWVSSCAQRWQMERCSLILSATHRGKAPSHAAANSSLDRQATGHLLVGGTDESFIDSLVPRCAGIISDNFTLKYQPGYILTHTASSF